MGYSLHMILLAIVLGALSAAAAPVAIYFATPSMGGHNYLYIVGSKLIVCFLPLATVAALVLSFIH